MEDWQELFGDDLSGRDSENDNSSSTVGVSLATAATGYAVGGSFAPPSQWSGDDN